MSIYDVPKSVRLAELGVTVQWSDYATAPEASATIFYSCGHTLSVNRRRISSWVPVKNGPMFYGVTEYQLPGEDWVAETVRPFAEIVRQFNPATGQTKLSGG